MAKKKIDLSDIKKKDLDETSSFTDLMTKKEKENRKQNSEDIDDMVNEKRKNTEDLSYELERVKKKYNEEIIKEEKIKEKKKNKEDIEESLAKTQLLELTKAMKFNFEEVKTENKKKKNGITFLNIIGILNLLCIGFYIYLLTFTNYQDKQNNYLIVGSLIVLLVLFFGLSVISGRKARKMFNIFNLFAIIAFIAFNIYTLLY